MGAVANAPIISVLLPTRNRVNLLRSALQSLVRQSLTMQDYEVLVVDDGSTDATADVCQQLSDELPLRYIRIQKAGTSAAKNVGIFAARGVLTLFFDDDDLADSDLLLEHVRAHQRHPEESIAVLGYTTWAPSLHVTEVMRYDAEMGDILFGYTRLKDGEMHGFAKFWAGRTSCKRSFLLRHAVFDPRLQVYEDVELGYRLTLHGLKVLYHRSAMSYMNRALTFAQVSRRCEIQGESRLALSRIHTDPAIQQYCSVSGARERWEAARARLVPQIARVRTLERQLEGVGSEPQAAGLREELRDLYEFTFEAYRLKGMVRAMGDDTSAAPKGSASEQSITLR